MLKQPDKQETPSAAARHAVAPGWAGRNADRGLESIPMFSGGFIDQEMNVLRKTAGSVREDGEAADQRNASAAGAE